MEADNHGKKPPKRLRSTKAVYADNRSLAADPQAQEALVVRGSDTAPAHGGYGDEVRECIRQYNAYYLQSVALKQSRPDLKAYSRMKREGLSLEKNGSIVGHLPDVPVGSQFFSRGELASTGLHDHWLAGINYVRAKGKNQPSVAISIVLSGGYEDDKDEGDEVTYTGQGGNNLTGNRKQNKDQVMTSGNLALKNAVETGHPVRLIRGHKCKTSYTGKVYTYDGVYKVTKCEINRGQSGFIVIQFKLRRFSDQPALTTEQVLFCKGLTNKRDPKVLPGLVEDDISGGQEAIPIHAVNTVDNPPVAPSGFKYTNKNILPPGFESPPPMEGCNCKGQCRDSPNGKKSSCACARRNGGSIPYAEQVKGKNGNRTVPNKGRLVKAMSAVFECGPKCSCGPDCPNRTVQHGIRFKLEVFKTLSKGWGVRSWDLIPAGAPVCEYTGELLTSDEVEERKHRDEYVFDLDCIKTAEGLDGRQPRFGEIIKGDGVRENNKMEVDGEMEYSVDAQEVGSVARFVNHSCSPNLFVQSVFYDHDDLRFPHIWLFAGENIVPLTELTYDYGYEPGSVVRDGKVVEKPCHCGAPNCRGRMY